jgi:hypothetical protein
MNQGATMDVQGSGKRGGRRYGIGACLAVAILASLALVAASGFGSEQAATQNISVTLSKGKTTVSGADTLVSGLTKITARNTGSAPANFALARILPGKTFADLQAETKRSRGTPEGTTATLTTFFGIAPGQSFVTTLNLPPGDYVTTQPSNGLGPAVQFSIANGAAGGSPPATTGTVLLYDYGISAPASIRGRGTLKVNDIGANYHFLVGIRLNRGVNADKVVSDIRSGKGGNGPPPGQQVTIIGVVNPGSINYVNTNLKPGSYVIACFNSDRHSAGHNHSQYGMVRKLTVK